MPRINITLIKDSQTLHTVKNCQFEASQYKFTVDGYPSILVCYHQSKYYAIENKCPHQKRELFGGCLREGHLICPHHGLKINITDGSPIDSSFTIHNEIKVFRVSESDRSLSIYLDDEQTTYQTTAIEANCETFGF